MGIRLRVRPSQGGGGGGDVHAFFDALNARGDFFDSWSLRDQDQLDGLVTRSPSEMFKYTWPTDDYARPQDAAKLWKPPRSQFSTYFPGNPWGDVGDEGLHSQQVLRLPLGISSGTTLLTWDIYWGEEFQTNAGWADNPVDAWKTQYLYSGSGTGGTQIVCSMHDNLGIATGVPGAVSKNHYNVGSDVADAAGIIDNDPLDPTGLGAVPSVPTAGRFTTYYNRWTRYWFEHRMDVPANQFTDWNTATGATVAETRDMISLWIADEQRDATRLFYRVPVGRRPQDTVLAHYRFAWNTSTTNAGGGGLIGPVIGYVRNMAVLRNNEADWTENNPLIFANPLGNN